MNNITTLDSPNNKLLDWDEDTYDAVMDVVRTLLIEKGFDLENIEDFEVYIGVRFGG